MNLAVNVIVLSALTVAVVSLVIANHQITRALNDLHLDVRRLKERIDFLEDAEHC